MLPDSLDLDTLLEDLGQEFVLRPGRAGLLQTTWFDSFDWRLYKRGHLLCHDGDAWRLINRKNSRLSRQPGDLPRSRAVFPRDLPPSELRGFLESTLAMRGLLPLFTDSMRPSAFAVKNRDDKTVVYLTVEEHNFSPPDDLYRVIRLERVRGYGNFLERLERFLETYGVRLAADGFSFFERGVASRGRQPLDYSSRFHIDLEPEISGHRAMTDIYLHLLESMRRNEPGILEDLDSEFLHDFRVAVRRTRTGLAQVKKVLSAPVTKEFKEKFAWLGTITGPTRDLDVYLLHEQDYRSRLPATLHDGLEPFFSEIRRRRAVEYRKLVGLLRSEKYKTILLSWQEVLEKGGAFSLGVKGETPAMELSGRIILRKYREIIRAGGAIGPRSPDEDLHRLRIQCKKLRYVLEFFASLYPDREMRRVIKELKRLQDNLGTFNDLSVQQEMLRDFLGALRPGSRKNQKMAAALGGLLTNLFHEHHRVRQDFSARFLEFAGPENRVLYKELFKVGKVR